MQYYSSYEVCSDSTRDLEDARSNLAAFSGFSSSAPPLPCGPACFWGRGLARRDAPRPRCAAGLMNAVPGETAAVAVYYGAEGRQASGAGFSSGASQKPLRTRGQLRGRGEAAAPRSAVGVLLLRSGSPRAPRSRPGGAQWLWSRPRHSSGGCGSGLVEAGGRGGRCAAGAQGRHFAYASVFMVYGAWCDVRESIQLFCFCSDVSGVEKTVELLFKSGLFRNNFRLKSCCRSTNNSLVPSLAFTN